MISFCASHLDSRRRQEHLTIEYSRHSIADLHLLLRFAATRAQSEVLKGVTYELVNEARACVLESSIKRLHPPAFAEQAVTYTNKHDHR